MGLEKRGGTNTHSGQGYHGESQWISGTGLRVGVPRKTPSTNRFFGPANAKMKVAKGLTTGEMLRTGTKPKLGREGL